VVDLFGLDHAVDLLKLDIEGGEWPILLDGRLAALRAGAVVAEWHGRRAPERRPREAVARLLRTAGYTAFADGPYDPNADVGVLWAWRAATGASARPSARPRDPARASWSGR
jgi:hypothetical protein